MIFSLQTEAYTGKSIEPSIFTLSIPEVEDVNFRLKDIPELMVESGIIIEEMTAKLESHEQGVRDIWGKMHEKFRSTSNNYIFSFVTFTIACISFLLTIFTLCRLQAVYIGLALIPSIKANMLSKIVLRPIPWSDMPKEPEPTLPATYSQSYNSRNYLAWLVGVALALLLLRAVKSQSARIARWVRCRGKPDPGSPWLRLKISVRGKVVAVPLVQLGVGGSGTDIPAAPVLAELEVCRDQCWKKPVLKMKWETELNMWVDGVLTSLSLPDTKSIPIYVGETVNQALAMPGSTVVIVITQPGCQEIQIPWPYEEGLSLPPHRFHE